MPVDARARGPMLRDMGKGHKHDKDAADTEVERGEAEPAEAAREAGASTLKRLSRVVTERPVVTLALVAGVGALAGAELLAAGALGGAAVLLLQRSDLRGRTRRVFERARERFSEGVRTIEHHDRPEQHA